MNMTNTVPIPKIREADYTDYIPDYLLKRNLAVPGSKNNYFLYISALSGEGEGIIFEKYEHELLTKHENVFRIFGMKLLSQKTNGVPLIDSLSFKSDNDNYQFSLTKVKEAVRKFAFIGRVGKYKSVDIVRIDENAPGNCCFYISNILLKLGFDFSNKNGVLVIGTKRVIPISEWLRETCTIPDPITTANFVEEEGKDSNNFPKRSRADWKRSALAKGLNVYGI